MADNASPNPVQTQLTAPVGFVEWGPIFAGGVLAAALSFVLLTFGTATGLSFTSPWQDAGASTKFIASLAVFWLVAQQIGSLLAGGYVAGRMRQRWNNTVEDEVHFRDGLHGGLVWAVSVIISAYLVFSTAGSVIKTGTEVAGRAAAVASEPLAYQIDTLLRPANAGRPAAAASAPASPSGATLTTAQSTAQTDIERQHRELMRAFSRVITTGTLPADERSYIAGIVTQRTGLSQTEAEARVTSTYNDAVRVAKETAEKARRTAILTGFVTAASLLLSLAAAWWAGIKGGDHRDKSVPARFVFNRP